MPMGLTGAPATYAHLKDITFGPIPAPNGKQSLSHSAMLLDMAFKYFCDDDYSRSDTFEDMFSFLHNQYFPRLGLAYLTLKPTKSNFFVENIDRLGMTVGEHFTVEGERVYGLKASVAKIKKVGEFPTPRSNKEIEDFPYVTIYRGLSTQAYRSDREN
ncbi:hypothetical protein EV426DRAFT_706094 [Tirmania nivea]|nr:hypothetical protein EV426DRAFT_706094 [Tirmania nivea]